jgi:hypothetical protein
MHNVQNNMAAVRSVRAVGCDGCCCRSPVTGHAQCGVVRS